MDFVGEPVISRSVCERRFDIEVDGVNVTGPLSVPNTGRAIVAVSRKRR